MDSDTASVLLVEDEPDLAELYASWLEDAYHVETVRDVATARAVDDRVDVVVVDGRPDGGAAELNDVGGDRDAVPTVVVTGTEPDTPDAAVDDYLLKPVSRTELRASVETQLLRRRYSEQLETYFELASKRATLSRRLSEAELRSSQEYAELEDRIAVLRTKIDETRTRLLDQDEHQQLYWEVSVASDSVN
ncbi:HalX domain-containing protein [Natronococcus occultus]|uniref:Response regulator with CheY-like receiver, AAA-type ATPase, and DNA-binding domains n=1 Tax=Natronococcus occultus SP4 TaxID=694430 RepID=L0JZB1_9EURY|nr:HalX domain-containing protein [Natronococcus occultus]AGB37434.1 response regulator with CheY-like receiver, AAA-type ATPase, and DNA-binding domains [Natronococcus occultus SP4]